MNREQAKEYIKSRIPSNDYLSPAPNFSAHNNTGYICPLCSSGSHGVTSTGAVKYYPTTNTWHCHACNRGGDVIDAYIAAAGVDYNQALIDLAAIIGITIDSSQAAAQTFTHDRTERPQSDENRPQDKYPDDPTNTPQNVDFTAYYTECRRRIDAPEAIGYLKDRGISTDTAHRYNLGYDPNADPAAAPGATGDEYKPHPTPRIIAPCTSDFYIARSIDPATPAAYKAPNPKGTRTQLFNAAALYSGADPVFITEGVFDALSFLEAGHQAIALNGKGNGKLLLQQLEEQPTTAAIIICPDNDSDPKTNERTQAQAAELNSKLRAMNLRSEIYNIAGKYHDANDALQHDRAAFEQGIAAAIKDLYSDDLTKFLDTIKTEAYKPYRTGLRFFDDLIGGGIIQQSLLLLMAAPGTGKTTLAQQIAETMAKERKPVLYFNFEMSREQMLAKAISAKLYRRGGDKSTNEILQGYKWTADDRAQIERVIDEYRRDIYPYIKYNPDGTSSEINDLLSYLTATGEKAKAAGEPAPAVIIDYLHLITSRAGLETAELIKQAVTGLKQYAINYKTFVIAIIATNRASNKGGKLTMESGRDSSNLEYTADYQLSLNYAAIDRGDIKPTDIEEISKLQNTTRRAMILRVLKSRFSSPGKYAEILFDAKHNIFYDTYTADIPADAFLLDDGSPAF